MIYEIKTEHVYENFSKNEEMLDFSNYSVKSKYYDYSNKLVVGKTKDKRVIVAVEEFVRLKTKDVLLNNKYFRHSMNRIQSKSHRIGTYKINKISFTIYILDNGYDGLTPMDYDGY